MSNIWEYMNQHLDSNELPTMQELLAEIDEKGGTDATLESVRERQYEKYHNELIWRYPISQGDSAGGFIMPVREGILWIPYDEMEKEAGEILRTSNATIIQGAFRCAFFVWAFLIETQQRVLLPRTCLPDCNSVRFFRCSSLYTTTERKR